MSKRFFILSISAYLSLSVFAQIGRDMPQWATRLPNANPHNHFYYRVTMGEGANYDKAYANAFAKAVMEAKWKIGVRVNMNDDVAALEDDITANISVQNQSMEIPMNKVCDYWEEYYPSSSKKCIRLYVLWQIADDARIYPKFEEFTNCN